MGNISLSIIIPTYNHEKFIEKALDSVLAQDIPYSHEILIGEDASTDNTRAIIRNYEKQYPGIFTVFYREMNMYGRIPSNSSDLLSRSKGNYIITLEGDDFWTDNNKIKKQVEFLEKHPEYIACAHNCLIVDEDGCEIDRQYPECKNNEYTICDYLNDIYPGQTTTVMSRNIYTDDSINTSILDMGLVPGDRLKYFVLISYGKIFCMQKKMSAYRFITNQGSSYSANHKYDFEKEEHWHKKLLLYAQSINNKKSLKVAEQLYFRAIMSGYQEKCCTFKDLKTNFRLIRHRLLLIFLAWFAYKLRLKIIARKKTIK